MKNCKNYRSTAAQRSYMIRRIALTGVLSGVSTVLMFLSFSVPLVPSFLKFDISEMPALLASFAFGPVEGVMVCLIKNLINLAFTTTGGVGELSNFLLGACFVAPAGIIYKITKTRRSAVISSLTGAFLMASLSVPINYYLTYPVYAKFMPLETIIGMYQKINPSVDGLFMCLLTFNVPFTFIKGLADVIITFLIYKRISPLLHGKNHA